MDSDTESWILIQNHGSLAHLGRKRHPIALLISDNLFVHRINERVQRAYGELCDSSSKRSRFRLIDPSVE